MKTQESLHSNANRKLAISMGVGAVSLLCVLLLIVASVDMVRGFQRVSIITELIDGYLRAMSNKDAELAYRYRSVHAREDGVTVEGLASFLEGSQYALYADYTGIGNISVASAFSSDPDFASQTVVSGTVFYEKGYAGDFEAVLEQDESNWKIFSIGINVPREKLEDFLTGQ